MNGQTTCHPTPSMPRESKERIVTKFIEVDTMIGVMIINVDRIRSVVRNEHWEATIYFSADRDDKVVTTEPVDSIYDSIHDI